MEVITLIWVWTAVQSFDCISVFQRYLIPLSSGQKSVALGRGWFMSLQRGIWPCGLAVRAIWWEGKIKLCLPVSGNQRESKKTIMFCSRREFDPIEKLTRGCCQCNKTFLLFISIFYFHFYESVHFITFVIFISCKHLVFVVKTNRVGLKCSEMVHPKNCKTKYYTKL